MRKKNFEQKYIYSRRAHFYCLLLLLCYVLCELKRSPIIKKKYTQKPIDDDSELSGYVCKKVNRKTIRMDIFYCFNNDKIHSENFSISPKLFQNYQMFGFLVSCLFEMKTIVCFS